MYSPLYFCQACYDVKMHDEDNHIHLCIFVCFSFCVVSKHLSVYFLSLNFSFSLVVLTYSRSLIVMFQAKWKQHSNLRVRLNLWEDLRPSWLGRPPRGFRLQLQRGFHLPSSDWSLSVSRVAISINNQHHHLTGVFLWAELQSAISINQHQ